jgi:hypothetical protein
MSQFSGVENFVKMLLVQKFQFVYNFFLSNKSEARTPGVWQKNLTLLRSLEEFILKHTQMFSLVSHLRQKLALKADIVF